MRFHNRVCVVTGAGGGIGRATCERFAAEGGKVAVIDISEARGSETTRVLEALGGEAIFVRADVSDEADVAAAVQVIVDRWVTIDVLVNNAAVMAFSSVVEMSETDWDRVISVNLRGTFLCCKYSLPHMQSGAIVNISSVHAYQTSPGVAAYAASKGAIEAFTRGLSQECNDRCVRVNCLSPGAADTAMLWSNPNIASGAEIVTGRVAAPAEIAAAVAFFASEDAAFVNGATLVADGGRLAIL